MKTDATTKSRQEKAVERNHRLTTIVYRKGEWSPELLTEDVRVQYQYCEVSHANEKVSEYAELLKVTMIKRNIDLKNVLYIAATDESLRAAQGLELAVLGYLKPQKSCEIPILSGVKMLVEGFEEVDTLFLERVYEREHHLPWVIAKTSRWILREFTMEDMDGLVELYGQPGVAFRMEHGEEIPDYIEPLLPRKEEEEYQRCYIENMYGYYGYGMWLVIESDSHRVIGRAGLENREYEDGVELEMGYVIDPHYWRRGIAYEVCTAIMKYAAENTEFERLNALTEADNVASIALLEKLGFTYMEDTDVSGSLTKRYVFMLK